ncbi:MAG: BamA/TamA family outer membrane protein [Sphingobium sp.]
MTALCAGGAFGMAALIMPLSSAMAQEGERPASAPTSAPAQAEAEAHAIRPAPSPPPQEAAGATDGAEETLPPSAGAPPAIQPPALPDPADIPSVAPVSESEFSLDLDDQLDIGVAWPNMDSTAPDVRLTGPLDGSSASEGDAIASPDADLPDALAAGAQEAGGDRVAIAPDTQPGEEEEAAPVPADDPRVLADDGSERRYEVVLRGLDDIADSQFHDRFNSLSTLKAESGHAANIAQINRRMELDEDLLDRILRADGYYGAFIRRAVQPPEAGGNGRLQAVLSVRPGVRYTLASVTLPGLSYAVSRAPKLETVFPVKAGDPIDADEITAGRVKLTTALGENGFPFATVDEPEVTIDHDTQKGDLEIVVRAGGYRRFGGIELEGETGELFSSRHLMRIARFDRDDVYQASDVEDLRRAIVATGLVSTVTVTPKDAGDGDHADIAVAAVPAPMRTISGEIGYGTGEGYRLEANWQHRNFFPPEGAINVQGLIGTREQAAGLSYRRNNFKRRDHVLTGAVNFYHRDYDAYKAKTLSLTAGLERQSNMLYQKTWSWSIGAQLLASRELNYYDDNRVKTNRNYLIGALPLSILYDSSDDLLNPSTGFRLGARVSPEVSWQGNAFTYVTTQVDGSAYVPVSDRVVVASRVRLGSILGGVDADRIAPSRRFYAGGGASVRGYAYQSIGPRDPDNDPYGGKSLMEFSLEARIKFGVFGVVPFIDAGNISSGFLPKMGDMRYGAGIGFRYYSTFGPIRIDVGTPLNRQRGDSRIAVYVSLGQAF